jgi:4-hydroxy-2-oxoheptanedioate aldolase
VRENKLKRLIREGRTAIGAATPFNDPEAVEFLGLLGFDFVFLDGEHGALSTERCQELIRAAELRDVETIVRVPANDPAVILGYLEAGAWNIQVPHVNGGDEARRAVRAVRYPPLGIRGAGSSTRAADYGLRLGAAEYFARANEQTMVIPMIEEPAAVERIDEIVAVEGLEAIFIGSGDLALTMGYPGQRGHPDVLAAIDRVHRAARAAGIAVGGVGGDAAANNALIEQDYQFLLNSAGALFAAGCRTLLDGIRR